MRFYKEAHERLLKASQEKGVDQCLYILPEVNNPHDKYAVMLSNGQYKLGSIASSEAPALRRMLQRWREESGKDDVLVVTIDYIPQSQRADFPLIGSIKVRGINRVNERLARKFSDKIRKE